MKKKNKIENTLRQYKDLLIQKRTLMSPKKILIRSRIQLTSFFIRRSMYDKRKI